MTEHLENADHSANFWVDVTVKLLTLAPIVGFVLALSYEWTFFSTLGVSITDILDLSDLVKSSALRVLPALPLIAIGIGIGVFTSPHRQSSSRLTTDSSTKLELYSTRFFDLTMGFITLQYLAFGAFPSIGLPLTLVFLFRFVVANRVARIFQYSNPRAAQIFCMLTVLVLSAFISMGMRDANKIKSGVLDHYPIVTIQLEEGEITGKRRLLRNLSGGILFSGEKPKTIMFLPSSAKALIEYQVNSAPFRGFLCGYLDICPAWLTDQMRMV